MMYKGILLDLDNTIYDYNLNHKIAMDKVYTLASGLFDLEKFKNTYEIARLQIHEQLKNTASSHNRLLYFQRTMELLKSSGNILIAKMLYDIYWDNFLKNMKLNDGVVEFFEKNQDKKICLITDLTAYIQYRKIGTLNIGKYIDYIVTSEEVGVEKPDKKMFECGIKKLGIPKDEICVIGDSYEKDIQGALKVGIKAFWKSDTSVEHSDITPFKDFRELIGHI